MNELGEFEEMYMKKGKRRNERVVGGRVGS